MTWILYISLTLTALYVGLILLYWIGWRRQRSFALPKGYIPRTMISVIIPARNEEHNIGNCIESVLNQDYPRELLEITVVDDHSTDATGEIVRRYGNGVRYIALADVAKDDTSVVAYKKMALATGIAQAAGELIVTTDADCTTGRQWLKHIAAIYEQVRPVMIVAPVDFTNDNSTVQVFQSLDFMSMQGITVASLQMKLGNMCNGANLAFQKSAYEHVGGYKGIDHLASGDDYLLMMKLNKAYPNAISYLKSTEAIVHTPPQPDWSSFLQQRIRWASKSGKYDDRKMTVVLGMVYLFNLSFVLMFMLALFNPVYFKMLTGMFIVKVAIEIMYLYPVAAFFNRRRLLWLFPVLQPLHIMYIVLAGFLGFVGIYEWKGRKLR